MITTICVLSGVCLLEAYIIAVLLAIRKEEHKYTEAVEPIDLVVDKEGWGKYND